MSKAVYRQRVPENSPYYQCVEDYFETFEQVYDERFPRQYGFLRPYVKQVIYRYLDCGILKNGFARVRCGDCGHEYLLAFSCKRRHFSLPATRSGWLNSATGCAGKSSRQFPNGMWCSAFQRSCAGIFCTIASCCPNSAGAGGQRSRPSIKALFRMKRPCRVLS
jgi:hypothetical protein